MDFLKDFLTNLAFLVAAAIVLLLVLPKDMLAGVLQIYDALGLLPVVLLLAVLMAIPRRRRNRRE